MKRVAITTVVFGGAIAALLLVPQGPPPVVLHIALTGSGAEWSTLGFATNYILEALTTSNLALPFGQWQVTYPVLDGQHAFYVTGAPPIFCTAFWQTKAQPGTQ